jgi:hypothetical protein
MFGFRNLRTHIPSALLNETVNGGGRKLGSALRCGRKSKHSDPGWPLPMRFLFWQDGCLYESDGEKTERISMPMYTRAAQMGSAGVIVEEEMTREQCRAKFPAPPLGVDLCAELRHH